MKLSKLSRKKLQEIQPGTMTPEMIESHLASDKDFFFLLGTRVGSVEDSLLDKKYDSAHELLNLYRKDLLYLQQHYRVAAKKLKKPVMGKRGSGYFSHSTRLSRAVSLAYAELDLANIELENLMIAELEGSNGYISNIVTHLDNSQSSLVLAQQHIQNLRQEMQDRNFQDSPLLQTTDLHVLGEKFVAQGLVEQTAWHNITQIMSEQGFTGVLVRYEDQIRRLIGYTEVFKKCVQELIPAASTGTMHVVLEKNQEGNIKVAFARLFTLWTTFQNEFLASSMLSTELWYTEKGFGSLCARSDDLSAVG